MAWPLTPLTSYVAGTTPAIKAADLNAMQATTNQQIAGTVTVAALVCDGTGGSAATPVAGTIKPSSVASGVGLPNTAVPWGTCYKDQVLFGGARVNSGGTLATGLNVKTINYTASGQYEVVLNGQPTNTGRLRAQVSSFNNGAYLGTAGHQLTFDVDSISTSGSDIAVTVFVYDETGAKRDAGFCLEVWGG